MRVQFSCHNITKYRALADRSGENRVDMIEGSDKWKAILAPGGGGGTPYIRMIRMIVVFFRGCNRRFSIFLGLLKQNPLKR